MIFIRTDANEKIATGHIMRCLSILKKVEALGEKGIFIFRDEDSVKILPSGIEYIMLESYEGEILEEIPQLEKILKAVSNPKLLLDSYEFTAEYMQNLKKYAKIITFDDMFVEKFPADIIINYNLYYTRFNYELRYKGTKTKLLLGGDYVPLRDEFQLAEKKISGEVSKIMLICGGGDKYHILPEILEKFCQYGLEKEYGLLVVAGALNTDIEKLKSYEVKSPNIKVYKKVVEMAELMQQVDLVIAAASTVLYECCAMQKATIFFTMAENQEYDMEVFSQNKMMLYSGDIRRDRGNTIENIIKQVSEISENAVLKKDMVKKMKQIIDGKGAERIARMIVDM